MLRALVLFLGLTVVSLGQSASESTDHGLAPDENPRYFPSGIFARGKSDGDFNARWYAQQLRALKEPTLSANTSPDPETYRFTWLRSFRHPIAIRVIVYPDGSGTLVAKMTEGAGGYDPGNLIVNRSREIGAAEIRRLRGYVKAMDFWRIPAEPAPITNVVNLDGAQWILEGSKDGTYHVVDRWSPEHGPLRDLGLYLTETLAKLHISAKAIY